MDFLINVTKLKIVIVVGVVSLMLVSCMQTNEKPNYQGLWVVKQASREGNLTNTLNGGYVKMTNDSFSTNFLPGAKVSSAVYTNSQIVLKDANMTFDVVNYEQDTLMIRTEFNNYNVVLMLERSDTIPVRIAPGEVIKK